jgi:alkanesulfonate monooxygenase SsuD/methylene tetrahydromethanopterin reductase-like flavin-dependent oxidoreductase (luciferase family)
MARLGIAFTGGLTPSEIVECVRLAESLGYESAWMTEGHGGDQFAILAACAVATSKIRLGTAISSVFVRSAPTLAMAAATVDHLSNGRLVLGLGSSHRVQVVGEHGLPYGQPIARLRETVDVVRALLRDGEVSHRGALIDIARFDLWFTPLRPVVPLYLAGVFGPMLEVCGEIADGAILTSSTLDWARRAKEHVATGARRAGRDPESVDLTTLIGCVVDDDVDRARRHLKPGVAVYAATFPRYHRLMAESGFATEVAAVRDVWLAGDRGRAIELVPDALIDAIALAGPAARCRARIAAYREAGIALPIVTPRIREVGAVQAAIRACAPA